MCFLPFCRWTHFTCSTLFLLFSSWKSAWISVIDFLMCWLNRYESCRSHGEEEKRALRDIMGGTQNEKHVLFLCTYCARTGELAGDVECDEVFPNNDIRHAVAVISHLGMYRRHYHALNFCVYLMCDFCLSLKQNNSQGQIHLQLPHI